MGSFGGFYKGEKKKAKKNGSKGDGSYVSNKPVFVLPKMLEKKKKAE